MDDLSTGCVLQSSRAMLPAEEVGEDMAAKKKTAIQQRDADRNKNAIIVRWADESQAVTVNDAVERAGMAKAEWVRMVLLAAAGDTETANALLRAHLQAQKAEL